MPVPLSVVLRFMLAALLCASAAMPFTGCSDLVTNPVSARIDDAQRVWSGFARGGYSIEERNNCDCPSGGTYYMLTVEDDTIRRAVSVDDDAPAPGEVIARFRTVDEIFALLRSIDLDEVASLNLVFDPTYGYPRELFIDPDPRVADDELWYSLRNFHLHE